MSAQQRTYHTNRVHPDEQHAAEMDELMDDAIAEAIADAAKDRTDAVTVDEAADWLDTIDEALEEWAESDEMARAFVAAFIQKGGQ